MKCPECETELNGADVCHKCSLENKRDQIVRDDCNLVLPLQQGDAPTKAEAGDTREATTLPPECLEPETGIAPPTADKERSPHIEEKMQEGKCSSTISTSFKSGNKTPDHHTTQVSLTDSQASNLAIDNQGIIVQMHQQFELTQKETEGQKVDSIREMSTPLSDIQTDLPAIDSHQLHQAHEALEKDHIILISSIYHDLAMSAAYTLTQRYPLDNEEKRILDFGIKKIESSNIDIDFFLGSEAQRQDWMLCVVNAITVRGKAFRDSLLLDNSITSKTIKAILTRNKLYLLCIVADGSEYSRPQVISDDFYHLKIEFLRPLLKHHYPKDDYLSLENEIILQRGCGLWSKNDKELYEEICHCLRHNKLKEEIERHRSHTTLCERRSSQPDRDEDPPEQRKIPVIPEHGVLKEISPELLFQDGVYLELKKHLCYVATYFPEMSPSDFKRLIPLFLQGKTMMIPTRHKRINDKGQEEEVEAPEERELIDIWKSQHDPLLSECHLESVRRKDSSRFIDFTLPYLRRDISDWMEQKFPIFVEDQFETIKATGLLFDYSGRVVENTIVLMVDMALASPEHHGWPWLIEIVLALPRYAQAFQLYPMGDVEQLEQIIAILQKQKELKDHVYSRLSLLIREMMNHVQLQQTVKQFLDHLFSINQDCIIEIVRLLNSAQQFNELYWIKQLIDRGATSVKSRAYEELKIQLGKSGAKLYGKLRQIASWLPANILSPEKHSPSSMYALRLLADYSLSAILRLAPNNYTQWRYQYQLFSNLDQISATQDLTMLVDWLFHPGGRFMYSIDDLSPISGPFMNCIRAIYQFKSNPFTTADSPQAIVILKYIMGTINSMQGDSRALRNYVASVILAEWFFIDSTKKESAEVPEKSNRIFNIILTRVAAVTANDHKTRRDLTNYWSGINASLEELRVSYSYTCKEERGFLLLKRKLIRELIMSFKAACRIAD